MTSWSSKSSVSGGRAGVWVVEESVAGVSVAGCSEVDSEVVPVAESEVLVVLPSVVTPAVVLEVDWAEVDVVVAGVVESLLIPAFGLPPWVVQ